MNKDGYEFDPQEDYVFYNKPLSRQNSFDALIAPFQTFEELKNTGLYDPNIRKDVKKLQVKRPWFLMTITFLQIAVLILSMVFNFMDSGSFIQTTPNFNYLIGPSPGVLIQMGARYIPCMRNGTGLDVECGYFACPDGIPSKFGDGGCYLGDVCAMRGLVSADNFIPNQFWRFLTAVMLHGGVVHLLFNLSFQTGPGFDLEKDMGSLRLMMIYFITGIGGFVFGAPLSDIRFPSVGASGALYGMIACLLLDLLQNWTIIKNPWIELLKMTVNIIFSLLIGTLPYVDNLAHVGGFLFGIPAGLLLMPKIYYHKWDRRRKQALMVLSLPVLAVAFYITFSSFFEGSNFCPVCKYFNCIPGMPWCDQKWSITQFLQVSRVCP